MDAQLNFEITNQHINRVDTFKPVAKSRNYLRAHFTFLTEEWDDHVVTAVFRKNENYYEAVVDNSRECLIPWEVIDEHGDFFVSCFADDLITTNESRVTVYATGYSEELESGEPPPSPNVYQQIIDKLENIDGGLFTDWSEY